MEGLYAILGPLSAMEDLWGLLWAHFWLWKGCGGYFGITLVKKCYHFGGNAMEGLVWAGVLKSQVLKI